MDGNKTIQENQEFFEMTGKVGGHMVHKMIKDIEDKMAAGEKISAAPSSPQEEEELARIRQENAESAQNRMDG